MKFLFKAKNVLVHSNETQKLWAIENIQQKTSRVILQIMKISLQGKYQISNNTKMRIEFLFGILQLQLLSRWE